MVIIEVELNWNDLVMTSKQIMKFARKKYMNVLHYIHSYVHICVLYIMCIPTVIIVYIYVFDL